MIIPPRPQNMPHHYRVEEGPVAAGANWSYTPQLRTWIQVNTISIVLSTDATVVDRRMILVMGGGSDDDIEIVAEAVQPASTSYRYCFMYGLGHNFAAFASSRLNLSLPLKHIIQNPEQIRTNIHNLQAGDQISYVKARLYQWFDPYYF